MEHLHPEQSSMLSPRSTGVERSLSRRHRRQLVGSVGMVPPDSSTVANELASCPRASYRRSRPCHRRETVSAVVATALLLCSPSFTAMASLGGRQPAAFHSHARQSMRPSMSMQTKALLPQPSARDPARSLAAPRRRSELRESRFGVRRRVRAVLGKARKRTSVDAPSLIINESRGGGAYYFENGLNLVPDTAAVKESGLVAQEGSGDGDNISMGPSVHSCYGTSARDVSAEDPAILTELGAEVPEASVKIGEVMEASVKNGAKAWPQPVPAALPSPKKSVDSYEPLPFQLPSLDREQSRRLVAGERVQFQSDMGRAGSGYVVWDVRAPAAVVWDCLLNFPSYPRMMSTVREVDLEDGGARRPGVPSVTRARFSLSKFRLHVAAVHEYRPHPRGDHMTFALDPTCQNPIMKHAQGVWHTESDPDGRAGVTRVWLLCELRVSRVVPQWIVDYAAARAMPRATTWLKPVTEAAARSVSEISSSTNLPKL